MDSKQCIKCQACKPVTEFYYIKRKEGHDTRCKACIAVYAQTRKEHTAQYGKRYHLNVRSRKTRAYHEKTDAQKAKQYQHQKEWRAKNRERFNHEARPGIRLRRSKEYLQHWEHIVWKYGEQCLCCGATDRALCFDHVVPLSMNGENHITNGQPLCRQCNTFKGSVDPQKDYRPDNGALIVELVKG